ncbi:MAG: hypothetical protein Q8S13_05670, partial [Dehalococcoidia bacterium]|nr:hypothetical protein [Dehalococcoidia bacterium]
MRGFFRWLRSVGNWISFGFVRRAEELEKSPEMIDGAFAEGLEEKQQQLQQLARATARIAASVETVAAQVETTEKEIEDLEAERDGALELGKKRRLEVEKAGGNSDEDQQYQEYLKGFEAAEQDLQRQQEALAAYQEQLAQLKKDEKETDLQLVEAQRYLESLRAERGTVAARARFDQMMRDIHEARAQISSEGTDANIQRARENARLLHAEAKVAGKMSGADARVRRAELRAAATTSRSRDRFAELTGGAKATDAPVTAAPAQV